ncbi:MAG: ABC transporter ATP-binding protein [Candidatus Marinimicrobia bacterium]|nr:ABC transporter ATP-binding protein [Candidatus Neomarinimicrobiota bacterium]MCF7829469.1 ABC transporter ATP-binding protein [Candidatus Neomarinimicrobiota bacterium]MCF7882348.1 ABC transporter ATP-binding protein [Candidatus Neomarinimicrobiota bacterium]
MDTPFLQIENLTKRFDALTALDGIAADIPENSIFGIIGPDGAGKSTLMKIVVGLIQSDSGSLRFSARDIRKPGGIGYMPQEFSLYPDLTVHENLMFFANLYKIRGNERKERYNRLLEFSRLTNFTNRRAENLSGGMKQKLALISVLMYAPPLLILDEPTTGVDPMARAELWEMLQTLKSEGRTILVSTSYMEEAVQCDEVIFLSHGKVLANNSPGGLKANYAQALFEVRTQKIMTILPTMEQTDWIHMIYPKGDRIHLSVQESDISESEMQSRLDDIIDREFSVSRISPGMEDVYAALEGQS